MFLNGFERGDCVYFFTLMNGRLKYDRIFPKVKYQSKVFIQRNIIETFSQMCPCGLFSKLIY